MTTDENKKWPKLGEYVVVPFTFPSSSSEQQKADVARTVVEFRNKTCVRLQAHNCEPDWIYINTRRFGCASKVGRQGGMQTIRAQGCLGDGGSFGLLVHEIMHSLGVYHQHSRPDRDSFILVNMLEIENVQQEDFIPRDTYKKQYEKCTECKVSGDYDISSIMHYPAYLGIKNRTVIVPKHGACDGSECSMGQRSQLSIGDVDNIQRLYDCGLKYNQYQKLIQSTIEKQLVKVDSLCQIVDCQLDSAKTLCPNICNNVQQNEATCNRRVSSVDVKDLKNINININLRESSEKNNVD